METIQTITETLLGKLGIQATYEVSTVAEQQVLSVTVEDAALLIGAQGDRLRSLNTIVRMIAEKNGFTDRFSIDVNNYQRAEVEKLQRTAKMLAGRARSLKYDVEMNPMRPFDRMIVHAALTNEPNIKTESVGVGRERRVVIKYIENPTA
jgi:spoIIIJ-associated protein